MCYFKMYYAQWHNYEYAQRKYTETDSDSIYEREIKLQNHITVLKR